jgi:hypothetical protein
MKNIIIFITFFAAFLVGCKKETETPYVGIPFTLTVNNDKLVWTKVNSEEFIRYDVYRSSKPIPAPLSDGVVLATRFFTTTDRDVLTITDSVNFNPGTSYYKVFAVLKSRQLSTNEVTGVNTVILKPGSFMTTAILPEKKRIYLFGSSAVGTLIYDLEHDSILAKKSFALPNAFPPAFSDIGGVQSMYYVSTGAAIQVLDPETFSSQSPSITFPGISFLNSSLVAKEDKLYLFSGSPISKLIVYNLSSKTIQSEVGTSSLLNTSSRMFLSGDKKRLFLASSSMVVSYHIEANGDLSKIDSVVSPLTFQINNTVFAPSYYGNYMLTSTTSTLINDSMDLVDVLFRVFFFHLIMSISILF